MVTDAQKKATLKYESKNYDKALLRMPKGRRDKIKAHAKSTGYDSLNAYINALIEKDMPNE